MIMLSHNASFQGESNIFIIELRNPFILFTFGESIHKETKITKLN